MDIFNENNLLCGIVSDLFIYLFTGSYLICSAPDNLEINRWCTINFKYHILSQADFDDSEECFEVVS